LIISPEEAKMRARVDTFREKAIQVLCRKIRRNLKKNGETAVMVGEEWAQKGQAIGLLESLQQELLPKFPQIKFLLVSNRLQVWNN
jgi:hypothetical protein